MLATLGAARSCCSKRVYTCIYSSYVYKHRAERGAAGNRDEQLPPPRPCTKRRNVSHTGGRHAGPPRPTPPAGRRHRTPKRTDTRRATLKPLDGTAHTDARALAPPAPALRSSSLRSAPRARCGAHRRRRCAPLLVHLRRHIIHSNKRSGAHKRE